MQPNLIAIPTADGAAGIEVESQFGKLGRFPAKLINNCHETPPRWPPSKTNIESTTLAALFQGIMRTRGFAQLGNPSPQYKKTHAKAHGIGQCTLAIAFSATLLPYFACLCVVFFRL